CSRVERYDAVAVRSLALALRARGRERGARMDGSLRQIAARQEADRAQQRDRDRPAIVEHGVLAQAVDADREPSRRAADRDEVMQARVVRRGLDPAAPERRAVRALDQRERGAGP